MCGEETQNRQEADYEQKEPEQVSFPFTCEDALERKNLAK